MSTPRSAATAPSRTWSTPCRPAPNCTNASTITILNKNWTRCSQRPRNKETAMTEQAPTFKPKKSVALSGVAAGNTALCSVGKTGNDLHYRGYDILDVATTCEFEEIAYLLVHGKLPNRAELQGYKTKLKAMRGV